MKNSFFKELNKIVILKKLVRFKGYNIKTLGNECLFKLNLVTKDKKKTFLSNIGCFLLFYLRNSKKLSKNPFKFFN